MEDDIRKLIAQVQQLQTENVYLKHPLDEAGISYSRPQEAGRADAYAYTARSGERPKGCNHYMAPGRIPLWKRRAAAKPVGKPAQGRL